VYGATIAWPAAALQASRQLSEALVKVLAYSIHRQACLHRQAISTEQTYLINGERSAAFTPLRLSPAAYRPEITRLASVEAG